MCSTVVLPAPFGPSSPVTPGPSVIVMSLTATTLPYHLDTPRRSTMLAVADGAIGSIVAVIAPPSGIGAAEAGRHSATTPSATAPYSGPKSPTRVGLGWYHHCRDAHQSASSG